MATSVLTISKAEILKVFFRHSATKWGIHPKK